MKKVKKIHHISATVSDAQQNIDFYTQVLGLRLVKKTLNYDDKNIYHLYYGNRDGSSELFTTFPYQKATVGLVGGGQVSKSIFAVKKGSLDFWKQRLKTFDIKYQSEVIFDQERLTFSDFDGLQIQLKESNYSTDKVYTTKDISENEGFVGIDSVELLSFKPQETLNVLEKLLGYQIVSKENNRLLLKVNDDLGGSIELIDKKALRGRSGQGTVHHIALAVDDIEYWYNKVIEFGLKPTEIKNRFYFQALYFYEPGGILIELSTGNSGVLKDENLNELGENFIIPKHFLKDKEEILSTMEKISVREVDSIRNHLDLKEVALREKIFQLTELSNQRQLSEKELLLYSDYRTQFIKLVNKTRK